VSAKRGCYNPHMGGPVDPFIADTHQDLAYHCLEYGRDLVEPGDTPCMITLPWLQRVGMRLLCATLFTEPKDNEFTRRYKLHSQYELYSEWFEQYDLELELVRRRADLDELAAAQPVAVEGRRAYPIGVVLLVEGCDLLDSPAEAHTWFARGVRMASLTWNGVNKYASGCFADKGGLKPAGRTMLREFERLGMILDVSHLSERSLDEALACFAGPVCAGHSNARAICGNERNLTDGQALEIARRGGVIGLNLLAPLLVSGWRRGDPLPALSAATEHSAYLADLVGAAHVGIGADLDGGLTPANTPEGINRIDDLPLLGDDLRRRGWDEEAVDGFMGRNWWRFFERSLPR